MKETHSEQPVKTGTEHGGVHYSLLTLDPGVSIWAVVTFVCLLLLLRKFAWNPILSSIDEREKRLQASLNTAEEARKESRKIAEEQKEILSSTRAEASQIIANAKKMAEEFKARIEQNAKEEKEKTLKSAEVEIESLKNAAIIDLKKMTAALAIGATEKLLAEKIDDQKSINLVEKYIQELEV